MQLAIEYVTFVENCLLESGLWITAVISRCFVIEYNHMMTKPVLAVCVQHCRRQLTLYFRCTADVTVHVIKKLLCMKLDIGRPFAVCIRRLLPFSATRTMACSLVLSRLDYYYCTAVLYWCSARVISRRQHVQNYAARVVTQSARFAPLQPLLQSLHWLPVQQ